MRAFTHTCLIFQGPKGEKGMKGERVGTAVVCFIYFTIPVNFSLPEVYPKNKQEPLVILDAHLWS